MLNDIETRNLGTYGHFMKGNRGQRRSVGIRRNGVNLLRFAIKDWSEK